MNLRSAHALAIVESLNWETSERETSMREAWKREASKRETSMLETLKGEASKRETSMLETLKGEASKREAWKRGAGLVPQGRPENSPAVHCWGCNPRETSPAGTAELVPLLLPSLRDSTVCRLDPALKRWAIIGRPCGTELPHSSFRVKGLIASRGSAQPRGESRELYAVIRHSSL